MMTVRSITSALGVAALCTASAVTGCGDRLTAGEAPAVTELPDLVEGALRVSPGGLDFGLVAPNSAHQAHLTLHNTGTRPITIVRVQPTCLCTAPQDLSGTVIPPGGSVPFSSGFQAPTETGPKSARIQLIFADGSQNRSLMVPLLGEITMAIRAEPPFVDALKGTTDGQVRLRAIDGRPFRVLSADGTAPVHSDGFDPGRDGPRDAYTLSWHVPARGIDDCAGARLWWVVETDHPECPILPLRIRHDCTGSLSDPLRHQRGWVFKEPIVSLGAIVAGVPVEADVDLHNRGGVPITGVESLSPDATAQLLSSAPGSGTTTTCRVRFTPARGARGMLYAMVLFRSPAGDKDVAFVARVMPGGSDR